MRYPNHILLDLEVHKKDNIFSVKNRSDTNNYVLNPAPLSLRNRTVGSLTRVISSSPSQVKKENIEIKAISTTLPLFDIHFLRKEKLYTKLKYSRCPQYDIVSGGFAAVLAGFIGFLISEKFGIELVDSGDFYIAFMYGVFMVFFLRPIILSYGKHETPYNPFSLKYFFIFFYDLLVLFIRFVKKHVQSFCKLWA